MRERPEHERGCNVWRDCGHCRLCDARYWNPTHEQLQTAEVRMKRRTVKVTLDPEEGRALVELARCMKREPEQQAAFLLRRGLEQLGLLQPQSIGSLKTCGLEPAARKEDSNAG